MSPAPSAGLVARSRSMAESMMQDSCTITRKTGQAFNSSTGAYEDTFSTVYSGKCRVQTQTWQQAEQPSSGGRVIATAVYTVAVPMSVTGVAVDDIVTITATAFDDALDGQTFRVRQQVYKTHMTARRLLVEQEQS